MADVGVYGGSCLRGRRHYWSLTIVPLWFCRDFRGYSLTIFYWVTSVLCVFCSTKGSATSYLHHFSNIFYISTLFPFSRLRFTGFIFLRSFLGVEDLVFL